MQGIKNILLDLGGVLLNLSYPKTEAAFAELGLTNFHEHFSQFKASPLFEDLETGRISQQQFLDHFRTQTGLTASREEVFAAWNAMLLDFPAERIDWLSGLADRYGVYLYSNTNAIHYDAFQETFSLHYPGKPFDDYFNKAYYSHILGHRKPYVASYQALAADAGIHPGETLFIDDTLINIEGAQKAGFHGFHLANGLTVLDIPLP